MTDRMIKLNDGHDIPAVGLGVFLSKEGKEAYDAVRAALDAGYRHIDTAAAYGNEESVGKAIADSGIDRDELFITTKLWNDDTRAGKARQALETSLKKLKLDYVDLYLIHWPADGWLPAWRDLEIMKDKDLARSIGVSNFQIPHLEKLLKFSQTVPAVNQVECHPRFPQHELKRYCEERGIRLEAWSPLGGSRKGQSLREDPLLSDIAAAHDKSVAQILIAWQLQRGVIAIPKSVHADRIAQNLDVFDIEFTKEEVNAVMTLDDGWRFGSSPDTFTF